RLKRGLFILWSLNWLPENFARRGMKNPWRVWEITDHFQQAEGAHGGGFASGLGNFETQTDVALAGQVINFIRGRLDQRASKRGGIIQVGVMQKQLATINLRILIKMIEPGAGQRAGAAN